MVVRGVGRGGGGGGGAKGRRPVFVPKPTARPVTLQEDVQIPTPNHGLSNEIEHTDTIHVPLRETSQVSREISSELNTNNAEGQNLSTEGDMAPVMYPEESKEPDSLATMHPKRKRRDKTFADDGSRVDITKLHMKDFVKNRNCGKKAKSQILKNQERRDERHRQVSTPNTPEKPKETINHPKEQNEDFQVPLAPQLMFKDGKMVVNKDSLVYKHELREIDLENTPVYESDAKRVTSLSYSKRKTVLRWTEAETRKFYEGLRTFGEDFSMIAEMFDNRNRAQVLKKFKKEESMHPDLIQAALNPKMKLPYKLTENMQPAEVVNTQNTLSTPQQGKISKKAATSNDPNLVKVANNLIAAQAAMLSKPIEPVNEDEEVDDEDDDEYDSDEPIRARAESYASYD